MDRIAFASRTHRDPDAFAQVPDWIDRLAKIGWSLDDARRSRRDHAAAAGGAALGADAVFPRSAKLGHSVHLVDPSVVALQRPTPGTFQ